MKEARLPMGLRKDLHIKAITEIPEVRDRWKSVYGKYPDQGNAAEVDFYLFIYLFIYLFCLSI